MIYNAVSGGMLIEDIQVGMTVSYSQTITDSDIKSFAGISGDNNPVHMSDEYATGSRYRKRIAHGFISASFFSALFGTKLPGPGCVYVSQSLSFKRPVFIGDTVTATIVVKSVDKSKYKVLFQTVCKVKNKTVIDGEAVIFIPPDK